MAAYRYRLFPVTNSKSLCVPHSCHPSACNPPDLVCQEIRGHIRISHFFPSGVSC